MADEVKPPTIDFDTAKARADGVPDSAIAEFLAPRAGFDLAAARRDKVPDSVIVNYLAPPKPLPIATTDEPQAPPQEPGSDAGAFFKGVAQGAVEGVGSYIEGKGLQAREMGRGIDRQKLKEFDKRMDIMRRIDEGEQIRPKPGFGGGGGLIGGAPDPDFQFANEYTGASKEERAQMKQGVINANAERQVEPGYVDRLPDSMQRVGGKIAEGGKATTKWGDETFPMTPEQQQSFAGISGRMAGGFAPIIASAVVGGPVGMFDFTGTQAYAHAYNEAKQKGADDDVAATAAALDGVVQGAANFLPMHRLFAVVNKVPLAARGKLLELAKEGAISSGTLLTFSQFAQLASNVVAQKTFDPNRPLDEHLGEHLGPTAAVGFFMGAGPAAVRQAFRPREATPEEVGRKVMDAPTVEDALKMSREEVDAAIEQHRSLGDEAGRQQADILDLFSAYGDKHGGEIQQDQTGNYFFVRGDEVTSLKPWDGVGRENTISPALAAAQRDIYGKMGIDVVYIDDANTRFDGVTIPGSNKIFLSTDPSRNAAMVGAHEVGHLLENTKLPDGTNLGTLFVQAVARGVTEEGIAHAREKFANSEGAPKREDFPQGQEGDLAFAASQFRFLIRELAADVHGEAPAFKSFLPRVIDAIQARYGADEAKGVLAKFIAGIQQSMTRLREMFYGGEEAANYGAHKLKSIDWLTNIQEVHDIAARIYAERFGTQAEKENAALRGMRERTRRQEALRLFEAPAAEVPPPTAPEGFAGRSPEAAQVASAPSASSAPAPEVPQRPSGPPLPVAYAEAAGKVASYRRWLAELDEQRRAEAPNSPEAKALQSTIDTILAKVRGNEDRLTKAAADRLEAARAALQEILDPIHDSPEMERVRAAMEAEQTRMANAASVGTPSPGMERAGKGGYGRRAPRPRPVEAPRGEAVMPAPEAARPAEAPQAAPKPEAPAEPAAAPLEAPAPTEAGSPDDFARTVLAERERIWDEDMGRRHRGLGKNERMVTAGAKESVMRQEVGEFLDLAADVYGVPVDHMPEIAKLYSQFRTLGDHPEVAFEKAADRFIEQRERDSVNIEAALDEQDWAAIHRSWESDLNRNGVTPLREEPVHDIPFPEDTAPARQGEGVPGGEGPAGAQGGEGPFGGGRPVGEAGSAARAAEGGTEGTGLGEGPVFSPRQPGPNAPGVGVEKGNRLGFVPALRVRVNNPPEAPKSATGKTITLITQGTTNKNAPAQLGAIDNILNKFQNATRSVADWARMQAYAFASNEVPAPPYAFIKALNSGDPAARIRDLTPGQIADANHGFEAGREFRRAYEAGELDAVTTGKLFMWSFLSRGVSPYTQESLFIDAFKGADRWIRKAAAGEFTRADLPAYAAWSKTAAPKGSGQPGAGATHNLNGFGKSFLLRMSQKTDEGISRLQHLHNMMADPNMTGQQIRREFMRFGEGVGIDNKVVSFTLLVTGHTDVMVIDRVQTRQLWDDGRFADRNIYDGQKNAGGKVITGTPLANLTYGARGLLIYEAIERGLAGKIKDIYASVGRPQDASIGRYHWESWVAYSQQEASHGTLDAILRDAKGDDLAIAQVSAKQGEYGAYEYGTRYQRDVDGTPTFLYTGPSGREFRFTVPAFRAFLADIKKAGAKVVPSKFKVTESGNAPWYERPEVNQSNLEGRAFYWADRGNGSGEGARAIREARAGEDVSGGDGSAGRRSAIPDAEAAAAGVSRLDVTGEPLFSPRQGDERFKDWLRETEPKGETTAREAVRRVMDSLEQDNPVRDVLRKIADRAGNTPVRFLPELRRSANGNMTRGLFVYDAAGALKGGERGEVMVRARMMPDLTAHVIAHESAHAVTSHAIARDKALRADIEALARAVEEQHGEAARIEYGIYSRDAREFLAEAMTNRPFQLLLRDTPAPAEVAARYGREPMSLWQALVARVATMLGLRKPEQITALDAAMTIADQAMERDVGRSRHSIRDLRYTVDQRYAEPKPEGVPGNAPLFSPRDQRQEGFDFGKSQRSEEGLPLFSGGERRTRPETPTPEPKPEQPTPRPAPTGEPADLFAAREPQQPEPQRETPKPRETARESTMLQDAGEKIGGARKDRWAERGLKLSDLEGMSEGEAYKHVTKDAVWPKPDYGAMVEAGMEPQVAALVKILRDRLGSRPKDDSPAGRRAFVTMMNHVREAYANVKTPEDFRDARNRLVYDLVGYPRDRYAGIPAKEVRDLLFSVYKGRHEPFALGYKDMRKAQEMLEAGFPEKVEPWTRRYEIRELRDGTFLVVGKGTGKVLERGIDSRDNAEEFARNAYESSLAKNGGEPPLPVRPHLDEIQRTGADIRNGRNVTGEDFVQDFGFRGVEFGNWVASDERQRVVNLAYDGLHDMAGVLGVPVKALSLDGQLGLAFGARGSGRAAAHYEPSRLVINMTKLSGAGSLAHEWAHALDHYFGVLDTPEGKGKVRGASGWYDRTDSRIKALSNLRPEMAEAFDNVMTALFKRDKTRAEAVRDAELMLENIQADVDQTRERIKKTEALPASSDRETILRDANYWVAVRERNLQAVRERLAILRDEGRPVEGTRKVNSSYFAEANKLSGKAGERGYWSRPTEMFARAFESYVFDKVKEQGNRSEYLVQGVEPERYRSGYKGNPYPDSDRPAINAAFDHLFKTMDVREGERGPALFSPRQEKREPAPTFYSAVERAVQNAKIEKAPPGQWLGTLKNLPGVKPEEVQLLGLEDWLKSQPKTVTKAEVLDYVRANRIEVTEVMHGHPSEVPPAQMEEAATWLRRNVSDEATDAEIDRALKAAAEGNDEHGFAWLETWNLPMALMEPFKRAVDNNSARYGQYTLPGGENYRELLLTLPDMAKPPKRPNVDAAVREIYDRFRAGEITRRERDAEVNAVHRQAAESAMPAERAYRYGVEARSYRSSHWDEPNVLAHIRFDDRTGPNGEKVLHVAEIQSDWHQAGRKKGYTQTVDPKLEQAAKRIIDEKFKDFAAWSHSANDMELVALADISQIEKNGTINAQEAETLRAYQRDVLRFRSGVPDAPFKTTWPELAMKRVIRYAAENGYDRVSWDTGETNADRYDLSAHIDEIRYSKNDDGTFDVTAFKGHDQPWSDDRATPKIITDTFGKEIADKIVEGAGEKSRNDPSDRVLSGLDLKVGGEGMRGFYDKQLPIIANKIGKKFGAKVEAIDLGTPSEGRYEVVDRGGRAPDWRIIDAATDERDYVGGHFKSEADAYAWLEENRPDQAKAHSLEITDAMRRAVVDEGQPLFSPRQTETPEFKRWFADSKVVDEDQRPKVVYHGTPEEVPGGVFKAPAFFTEDAKESEFYSMHRHGRDGGRTYPVYLDIKNPIDARTPDGVEKFISVAERAGVKIKTDIHENYSGWSFYSPDIRRATPYDGQNVNDLMYLPQVREQMRKEGYDGLQAWDGGGMDFETPIWVPLDPTQIKSAIGNSGTFDPNNPDIAFSPRQPVGTENMTDTERAAVARVRGVEGKSLSKRVAEVKQDFLKKAIIGIVDPYYGVKERDPDNYVFLRNANSVSGAVDAFNGEGRIKIEGRAYKGDGQRDGGPDQLIRDLGKDAMRFMDWVAANRAERLKAEDRENLYSDEDIATLKGLNRGRLDTPYALRDGSTTTSREAAFRDALARLDAINKNARDIVVDAGLVKRDVVDAAWSDPYYVPFYRQAEEDNSRKFVGASTPGMTGQTAGKKLKGGTEKLNTNLWQNAYGNWAHMIDAAIRNKAANETLMQGETDGLVSRVSAQDYDHKMSKAEKADVVWTMVDGEKQYWRVEDPFTLKAVAALDYVKSSTPGMQVARAAKKLLQAGVAASPFFQIRNLERDVTQSMAVSPISLNVFRNMRDGVGQLSVGNALQNVVRAASAKPMERADIAPETADAIAGGATMRYANGADQSFRGPEAVLDSSTKIAAFWQYFARMGRAASEVLGNSENINRLALYKQLREKEVPHDLAAFEARDLADFTLVGASPIIRHVVETVPYMNAWLQGLYKVGRAAANNDKNIYAAIGGRVGMQVATKLAVVMTGMVAANLALDAIYANDPDYQARTEDDRNSNFWFKVGGKEFRVPMGFEIAALARMAALWTETLYDKNVTAGRAWENTLHILGTQMSLNPTPQVIKPMIDVYGNETRTGAPIETAGMERLRPEYRSGANTTLVAKGISDVINKVARGVFGQNARALSPVQLDYLAQAYAGWLGTTALQIADTAVRGVSNEPVKPAGDWLDTVTGGMVRDTPSSQRANTLYTSLLYKQGDAIKEAYATFRDLTSRGRGEEAKAYLQANRDLITKYPVYNRVMEAEAEINKQIKTVSESRNLTAEQKRVQIMRLNAAKNRAAEGVFRAMPQ